MKRYFYGECLSIGIFSAGCYFGRPPEPKIQASDVVEAEDPVMGMDKLRKRFQYYSNPTIVNFKEIKGPE